MQAIRFLGFQSLSWCVLGLLASNTTWAEGQQYQNPFLRNKQSANEDTPALKYFGGRLPARAPAQNVRQRLPDPQPVQLRGAKPFNNLKRGATLSPYLGLDYRTSEFSIPNYHAFVRPQQQQQISNQAQIEQVRRLKQQLRMATAQGIVSNNPSGGVPTTGHSAQFLNMGGFFPAPR